VAYVEEKGQSCDSHLHRRNHTIAVARTPAVMPFAHAQAS
jgi:hypothetical protein